MSQDLLAICLVLADGDLDRSIEEVVARAEHYEATADRHFGTVRGDFRGLFVWLTGFGLRILPLGSALDGIGLGAVAKQMLDYREAYWNDEGGWLWFDAPQERDDLDWVRGTPFYEDLDDAQWREKLWQRAEINAFFRRPEATPEVASVRRLMARLTLTEAILEAYSRPGASS